MQDAQPSTIFDKTIEDFHSGTAAYQTLLENFLNQAAAVKESISKDRAALAQEREQFEQERARVAQAGPEQALAFWPLLHCTCGLMSTPKSLVQVSQSVASQVTLNVGGTTFTTTSTTLRNAPDPSLFSAMFSGRHPLQPDEVGLELSCSHTGHDAAVFDTVTSAAGAVLCRQRPDSLPHHPQLPQGMLHPGPAMCTADSCCCPYAHVSVSVQDQTFNYPGDNPDYRYLLEVRAEADFYGLVKLTEAVDMFPVGYCALLASFTADHCSRYPHKRHMSKPGNQLHALAGMLDRASAVLGGCRWPAEVRHHPWSYANACMSWSLCILTQPLGRSTACRLCTVPWCHAQRRPGCMKVSPRPCLGALPARWLQCSSRSCPDAACLLTVLGEAWLAADAAALISGQCMKRADACAMGLGVWGTSQPCGMLRNAADQQHARHHVDSKATTSLPH